MMKKNILAAVICAISTALLILLIRFVDVAAIGPEGTEIGLSHINQSFHALTGVHLLWYEITDWLGVVAILAALLFAFVGLMQLIRRRGILKVDREILALGVLYVLVFGLYVLFEILIVNYRPIIMPGDHHPEASFPSSHTMLVCVILGSAVLVLPKYVKSATLRRILLGLSALLIAVTVIGRLISGVHWLTDILGGLLISGLLLAVFSAALNQFAEDKEESI